MEGNIKHNVLKSLVGRAKLLVREPFGRKSLMVSWGKTGFWRNLSSAFRIEKAAVPTWARRCKFAQVGDKFATSIHEVDIDNYKKSIPKKNCCSTHKRRHTYPPARRILFR